jgi:hypothetical protein
VNKSGANPEPGQELQDMGAGGNIDPEMKARIQEVSSNL